MPLPPLPLPTIPEAPSRADPTTFEERNDAAVEFQFNTLPPWIEEQVTRTFTNTTESAQNAANAAASATAAAGTVSTVESLKNQAAASAADAAADAVKTAADRQAVEQALIDGPVLSVNGKAGVVTLGAEDVGAARADLSNVSQTDARAKVGTGTMAYRDLSVSDGPPVGTVPGQIHFQFED